VLEPDHAEPDRLERRAGHPDRREEVAGPAPDDHLAELADSPAYPPTSCATPEGIRGDGDNDERDGDRERGLGLR
jgi:hypothetical protein